MYLNSSVLLVTYILTSIVKVFCILAGYNIVIIQLGFLTINMLGTLVYYFIARKKYPWINFKEQPNMQAISQKNSVMIHKISGIVFQNTDIVILTIVCGLRVVSIYTMYKLVINMITTVIASFGDSYNYLLGQTFNGANREQYEDIIDTFNVFYSIIAFGLFTVTSILVIPFLKLYTAGMDINYIYPMLPLMYILIEVLQVGREAMLRTITVAGHFKGTIYSSIIEMVINLSVSIAAVLLCKYIWGAVGGLYGVLTGTIIALLYRTIDVNHYANRKILNRSAWKTNKVMLINFMLYTGVYLITQKIRLQISSYVDFCIVGAIITVLVLSLYAAVQCAANPKETTIMIHKIRNKR